MRKASEIFEALVSLDFESRYVASTPSFLRELLSRSEEVRELRHLYASGSLTDEEIGDFVSATLQDGLKFDRFPFQHALAAVAVMLESSYTLYASKFLDDLGRIGANAFSMCSGVARKCNSAKRMGSTSDMSGTAVLSSLMAGVTAGTLLVASPPRPAKVILVDPETISTNSASKDNSIGLPLAA